MNETDAYADRTIAAYRMHARRAIANWRRIRKPSRFLREFAQVLPSGGRLLDYGCGIGTDLAWLAQQGFPMEGVEGTLEFVQESRRRCPSARILHARFESIPLPAARYDGIWCNAALIHVPPEEFRRQIEKIRRALKSGGWLGLTLAWGRRKGFLKGDWIPGRYLAGYRKGEVEREFLAGWKVHALRVLSGSGRQGRWIQLLARKNLVD